MTTIRQGLLLTTTASLMILGITAGLVSASPSSLHQLRNGTGQQNTEREDGPERDRENALQPETAEKSAKSNLHVGEAAMGDGDGETRDDG